MASFLGIGFSNPTGMVASPESRIHPVSRRVAVPEIPFPMKTHVSHPVRLFAFGLLSCLGAALCRADGPYHLLNEIPVGGEGGWDYLSVDPAGHRLYVSHATKAVVIDTAADKGGGEVADTRGR